MLNNKILRFLKENQQETFWLIKQLSQIPAPSENEHLRVKFIKNWFDGLGAKDVYVDDALNVVCPINCQNSNDIVVFMSHTDVVFPDTSALPYFEDEKFIHCPGVGDDTTCLVQLLIIAKYLFQNNLSSNKGVLIVANSCEEGLGNLKGIRKIMQDFENRISLVYTFDGCYNCVVNKAVGSHRYEVCFNTEGGHSFNDFGKQSAIYAMSRFICDLYACDIPQHDNSKTTFNVGKVDGGTSVNTIAQSAKLLYEYRSDDKICLDKMTNFFHEQVEKARNKYNCEIAVSLLGDRPCSNIIDQTKLDKVTNQVVAICQKHSNMKCQITSGSTDANIPLSLGIPAVCVGSHLSFGAHTREEKVLKESVPIGLKIMAEIILEYFNN